LLKHLRKQKFLNEKGYRFGLGEMTDDEREEFASYIDKPFRVVSGETMEHNLKHAASMAQDTEPQLHEFETKGQYLQAKARWSIKQRAELERKQLQAKYEAEMLKKPSEIIDPIIDPDFDNSNDLI